MVSTRPSTFKSSRPFNNPSVTVPKAPIIIIIIVIIKLIWEFFPPVLADVFFYWSLSDDTSP